MGWPIRHNLHQLLVSADQFLTCALFLLLQPHLKVWGDETLSCRAERLRRDGKPRLAAMIDWLFGLFGDADHCRQSAESERLGRQLPPELRG